MTSRSRKRWTLEEDMTLCENIDRLSYANSEDILPGRTTAGLQDRIMDLGLADAGIRHNGLTYTCSDAAAILGISAKTVRRWIAIGLIRGVEVREPLAHRSGALASARPYKYRIPHPSIDDLLTDYPMIFDLAAFPPMQIGGIYHRKALVDAQRECWVKCREAARYLSMDDSALRSLARRGSIPGKKVLVNWYFKKTDLQIARRRSLRDAA